MGMPKEKPKNVKASLSRILKYIGKNKNLLFAMLLVMLGATLLNILAPSLQAKAIETVANSTDTLAAISLMDLSVEAEAFGAEIRMAEDEVPTVVGHILSDAADAQTRRLQSDIREWLNAPLASKQNRRR